MRSELGRILTCRELWKKRMRQRIPWVRWKCYTCDAKGFSREEEIVVTSVIRHVRNNPSHNKDVWVERPSGGGYWAEVWSIRKGEPDWVAKEYE